MKPSELYAREPESVTYEVGRLVGFKPQMPELEGLGIPWVDPGKLIEIRIYKHFNFDYRRFWALASAWYIGHPFMIIRNAGREGDDHCSRFITNAGLYEAAVKYLRSIALYDPYDRELEDVVDAETDIPDLTEFYGNKLDGHFEKARY